MTDETEAVALAIANTTDFDGDRMASRYADSELRDLAQAAITALDKHRIERAGEVEQQLEACAEDYWGELACEAATTIAALRAEIERAKLDGVRAGIEASARHCGSAAAYEPHNECCRDILYDASLAIRALSAEAITKGEG